MKADAEDSMHVLNALERYFGARSVYGIDTPIDCLTVFEACGIAVGCNCLSYVPGITNLRTTLAIECLRAHLTPWDTVFPGDNRVRNLLDLMTLYLQSRDVVVTPRQDSCGKDIPGFYGVVDENTIIDLLADIKASTDALPIIRDFYEYRYWSGYGSDDTGSLSPLWVVDPRDRGTFDPTAYHASPLYNYQSKMINNAMSLDPITHLPIDPDLYDPDYYFKESYQQFDLQVDVSHTAYRNIIVAVIKDRYATAPSNHTQVACQLLVNLLSQAKMMILYDCNSLNSILVGIKEVMSCHASQLRMQMQPVLNRVYNLQEGMWTQTVYPSETYIQQIEQTVIDIGLNLRASLLRDIDYVRSFDTDHDGMINADERARMETDVRARMVSARAAYAMTLYTQLQAQYASLTTLYDGSSILSVITPYLM